MLLQRYWKVYLNAFSTKAKARKEFQNTLVTTGTVRWRVLEFDTLRDIVPFEVSLFSLGLTWHFGLLSSGVAGRLPAPVSDCPLLAAAEARVCGLNELRASSLT